MKKLLLLAVVLGTLVSCGGKKEAAAGAAAPAGGKVKIGVTVYKYDDNFMALVRQEIEKLGGVAGAELIMNDSQNSQSTQNDQVDVMISKGVKVLAINLVDPAAAQTIIDKAKAANIPVVFYNKEPTPEAMASWDKVFYVGTKSEESGIIQGDIIEKQWKAHPEWDLNKDGKIQYVMLKGEPGHPDAEARTKYSIKELNDKGIQTEKLQEDTAMWDTAQAKDKMDAWISGPNRAKIEVVITTNDGMALGAIESLKGAGKKLPVFGVDAFAEAIAKIESGEMMGTVLNDAKNQAKATFELAFNLAQGKDAIAGTTWKLVDKAVRVAYVGVDKDNAKDFK